MLAVKIYQRHSKILMIMPLLHQSKPTEYQYNYRLSTQYENVIFSIFHLQRWKVFLQIEETCL